jgi:DNA polymerase IV
MPEWQRVFAHVDMDAFYASVEIRDDPSLVGKPVVVGGSAKGRGVISAASYEARKYGIHSAMPTAEAQRRCPQLVLLPVDFTKYRSVSAQIMTIFARFSPVIEPLSLDEAFLDLSGTARTLGPPETVGRDIKAAIHEATRLTASVGIAPVKFVAKIASDLEKPDGLVIVVPGAVTAFLAPLPIGRLWGVGPRTRETLEGIGIRTIGDLAAADAKLLTARFGQSGEHLYNLARGRDEREVIPDWDAKSYSHEETFPRDRADLEFLEGILLDQAQRVSRRLRQDAVAGRVVQLKLRFGDFRTITRRVTLARPTTDAGLLYRTGRELLHRNWEHAPIRLIGLGMSGIAPADGAPLDLFEDHADEERRARLAATIDRLDARFGHGTILPAKVLHARAEQPADDDHPRHAGEPPAPPRT